MNQASYDAMGFYTKSAFSPYPEQITAYHITKSSNVSSIIESGLIAKACHATARGEARQAAVYLLAYKCDAYDKQIRNFLFDDTSDLAVIKVTIPSGEYEKLRYDGLFNLSCICEDGSFPSGIQFTDDIPADWVKVA